MRKVSSINTWSLSATSKASSPKKVCMFLLGMARADYRVMRNAITLVRAGFDVAIVDVEQDANRPVEEEFSGVHLKHIVMPSWFVSARFKPWFLVKLALLTGRSIMCLLQTSADIYHANVERSFLPCYVAARLRSKPFLLDNPEMMLSYPNIKHWRILRALAIWLIRQIAQRSAGYLTGSPLYVHEFRKLYHVADVTVVRHVPVYRSVPKSDRLRQYLGLDPQVCIALYQGNIQSDRGLDRLVDAASFLEPSIIIVMMGRGVGETPAQLADLISRNGVTERVKMIPPVPQEELLDWTASADIGLTILPPEHSLSIRWCLPNKFFEYLMAGLPVLSAPLDAVAEIIRAYDVGQVVPSLAPTDIGRAINTMLADSAALQRMRRNALQAAQQEFHWEKESQKLLHLYSTILAE